jgi:hypothetical protein
MSARQEIIRAINGETDNDKIDSIIMGYAKQQEMTAICKPMVLQGKQGVGIFINGGLSKWFVNGVELLNEVHYLQKIGYKVGV